MVYLVQRPEEISSPPPAIVGYFTHYIMLRIYFRYVNFVPARPEFSDYTADRSYFQI